MSVGLGSKTQIKGGSLGAAMPARVYSNEGLCQIVFLESDEICETSYKDKKGKYQAQKGIVLPKI